MLNEKQPFKATFGILQFAGLWRAEKHSIYHKFIALVLFLWLHPIGVIFLFLSLLQVENVGDSAKSIFFLCVTINAFSYDLVFMVFASKVEALVADFDLIFNENPAAKESLIKICDRMYKDKIGKMSVLIICITIGISMPFLTGALPSPIYTPKSIENSVGYFWFSWTFEVAEMLYLAIVTTFTQDLFLEFLYLIKSYVQFFKNHLRKSNLCGIKGKLNLIECINFHQKVKMIVEKYSKIGSFPLALQMLLSTYLLCTLAFTIVDNNGDRGETGFLVALGTILMLQQLLPCYIAQDIESSSEEFMMDLEQSNWIDADVKQKKNILFFMSNLSHPATKFNLFGIVDLNLKTFLSILNATFSTYALLNSLRG